MNSRVPNSTALSSSSSSELGYSEMLYASSTSSKLMDIVVRLNNVGVACVESSKFVNAKQCFERALARTNATSPLSAAPSKFHQQQTGTTTEKPNKSELYVFQREEYDEGMGAFSDPVNINTASRGDLSDNAIQATILYNVRQLCVKMGENEDALESFCLALKALRWSNATRRSRAHEMIAIAILHNIGHLQYRTGMYDDAVKTYTRALEGGTKLHL